MDATGPSGPVVVRGAGIDERANVGGDRRGRGARRDEEPYSALAVDHEALRRMVDRVRVRRLAGSLGDVEVEVLHDLGGRRGVASQPHERRVECRRVLLHEFTGVAFGVERHEEDLHFSPPVAQLLDGRGHLGKRGRADVWAMRESEDDDHHLAAEIRDRALAALGVGEFELAAHVAAGDVDAGERPLRRREELVATAERERREEEHRGEPGAGGHPVASGR